MHTPQQRTATFILSTGEGSYTERLEIVGTKGTALLEKDIPILCIVDIKINCISRVNYSRVPVAMPMMPLVNIPIMSTSITFIPAMAVPNTII